MFVWGGRFSGSNYSQDGGLYDPAIDAWSPVTTVNAPFVAGRAQSAVWTGTEVIEWEGHGYGDDNVYGGRYNPATDTWRSINAAGAPTYRSQQTAVWTGTEMIVYGQTWGGTPYSSCNSYSPSRVMYLYLRQ